MNDAKLPIEHFIDGFNDRMLATGSAIIHGVVVEPKRMAVVLWGDKVHMVDIRTLVVK